MTASTVVAGKLIFAGLQRSFSIVVQKAMRLKKVDQAIRGIQQRSEFAQRALSDLETVLGTYQGIFTKRLDLFLRELEKAGIIEIMVQSAFVGQSNPSTIKIFRSTYYRFIDNDAQKSDELYDSMVRSFTVTLEELSKDKSIYRLVSTQFAEIRSRLDVVDEYLLSLAETNKPRTFEELLPTLVKICKGLQSSFRTIRVETNKGARNVDISRIYIPPTLHVRDEGASRRYSQAMRLLRSTSEQIKLNSASRPHRSNKSTDDSGEAAHAIQFSELKTHFSRVVILGDPGGGKSTICQRLCYDLARNAYYALQAGDRPQIPAHEQQIPIRIILRQFEQARAGEAQLDLLTFIYRDLTHHVTADVEDIRECLDYIFSTGRAVFAFDGLDEILETSKRRDFVDLVNAFCRRFPLCPVIVTSRLVGYDRARMPEYFDELVLDKFNTEEVNAYVTKFFHVVGEMDRKESAKEAGRFMEQTSRNASDLRRNPLMLGLMAWLFVSRKDVPSNRPEIYRECAVLMFERWDPDRGILAEIPDDFDRLQLFSDIASKIYGDPELAAGVERSWLDKHLKHYFSNLYENQAKSIAASKSLLEFLVGRAWVMTEIGDGVFAFTHQTFLEYFFARNIDDKFDTVSDLLKYLRPRIVKKEWDVAAHLSLQLKTYRNNRRQEEAISLLVNMAKSGRPSERAAIASFSAKALEYLKPNEVAVRSLLESIYAASLELASKGDRAALSNVGTAARASRDRKSFVDAQIAKLFRDTIFSGSRPLAEAARSIFADVSTIGRGRVETFLPAETAHLVLASLRPEISSRQLENDLYAGLAWSWYREISAPAVAAYGPRFISENPPIGNFVGVDGLTSLALLCSDSYSHLFGEPVLPVEHYRIIAENISGTLYASIPIRVSARQARMPAPGIPPELWIKVFKEFDDDLAALSTILFIYEYHRQIDMSHRRDRSRDRFHKYGYSKSSDYILKLLSKKAFNSLDHGNVIKDVFLGGRPIVEISGDAELIA